MDSLKKNMIIVASGAVCLLAFVAIIFARLKLSQTDVLLADVGRYMSEIEDARSGVLVDTADGKSQRVIITDDLLEQRRNALAKALGSGNSAVREILHKNVGYDPKTKTCKRMPLIEGVFPESDDQAAFKFRGEYRKALQDLLTSIDAGMPPTTEDVDREEENIRQEYGISIFKRLSEGSRGPSGGGGGSINPTETGVEGNLKDYAAQRAAIARAEKIRIYADKQSLDVNSSTDISNTGAPPTLEDMWDAQVSLWIQQDIARAIAEVNQSAKNVADSVVKQLVKVKIDIQQTSSVRERIGSASVSQTSFTGLASTQNFDVVRINMDMVVDVRRVLEFVNALHNQGQYVMCDWQIKEGLEPERTAQPGTIQDYRYGPAPVVRLISHWETCLLRDFYHSGIVDYNINKEGKPVLVLYDGTEKPDDADSRSKLKGLMPMSLRNLQAATGGNEAIGGESPRPIRPAPVSREPSEPPLSRGNKKLGLDD